MSAALFRTQRSSAPTIDTDVNYWPAIIDLLTSLLMFFMLVGFLQQHVNPASLNAKIAHQKQQRFADAFRGEFARELERQDIALVADVNLMQITFGEEILFGSREYKLRPRGEAVLQRLAGVIRKLDRSSPSAVYDQIQIEGHTDDRRLKEREFPHDNWELSVARALEVLRYLTERTATPLRAETMSANGYADTRPVGRSRAKTRRIEIRVYFSGLASERRR
jgi:flagellar motor protein MotB